MPQDKQLPRIKLKDVLEKRRLDQALNAKEFAVLAGISYSTAREWFRLPGFPVFRGVVFWQDFAQWRMTQNAFKNSKVDAPASRMKSVADPSLPPRASRILQEA